MAGYGRGKEHEVSKKVRCDTLIWLTSLLKQTVDDEEAKTEELDRMTHLRQLVHHISMIKSKVNEISPQVHPNERQRIRLDGEEIQLARYDGMLGEE